MKNTFKKIIAVIATLVVNMLTLTSCKQDETRIDEAVQLYNDNAVLFQQAAQILIDNGDKCTIYDYGDIFITDGFYCVKKDGLYYYSRQEDFTVSDDLSDVMSELFDEHHFVAVHNTLDESGNRYIRYSYWSTMGKGISIVYTHSGEVYSANDWYNYECAKQINDNWYIEVATEKD